MGLLPGYSGPPFKPFGYSQGASHLMTMHHVYAAIEPERAEIGDPHRRHIKIADCSGRRLGRSFKIKLWPTLVLLSNGRDVACLVRPDDITEIRRALAQIDVPSEGRGTA